MTDKNKKRKAIREAKQKGASTKEAVQHAEKVVEGNGNEEQEFTLEEAQARIEYLEQEIERITSQVLAQMEVNIETLRSGNMRLTEGQDRNNAFIRMHTHEQRVPRPGPGEVPE